MGVGGDPLLQAGGITGLDVLQKEMYDLYIVDTANMDSLKKRIICISLILILFIIICVLMYDLYINNNLLYTLLGSQYIN